MIVFTIVLVTVYAAVGVVIGVRAAKRRHISGESYFLADRSLSWGHLALTLFATWMSTFAFIGSPGFYYKNGVSWYLPHAFLVVASPMIAWFIGRRLWRLGRDHSYITPGDLLADRLRSEAMRYIVAVVCILALVPYCLIQLIGIGKVVSVATDGAIPFETVVLGAGVIVAIYTLLGGIRAIVGTDVMQAVIFGIVIFGGSIVAIIAAGGIQDGYVAAVNVKPAAYVFSPEKIGGGITLMIVWSCGYVLLPHMWQRYYMAKSAKSLVRGITAGSVLALVVIAVPSMLIGTLGMGLYPGGIEDTDRFMPQLFVDHAPLLLPLLLLGTFAAGMSTIDSQLLSAASVVVRDVVNPITGGRLSDKHQVLLGRAVVVVLLVVVTTMAASPIGENGNIILLASKGTGIALLLLVPLLYALFSMRRSGVVAVLCLAIGMTTSLPLEFGWVSISLPFGFGPPVAAVVLQALCVLVSAPFTRQTDSPSNPAQNGGA